MQNPSRRNFIRSATALAGSAFAPNLLLGQEKKLNELHVAAIGCGGKGWSDISEIAPGNRVSFLCDVDKNQARKAITRFPEAPYFSDYREMFAEVADQIDVVTVSTPDHMHFPIACEAIKHGKPVMVQKPMCNTLWETRALAKFAKEKGVLTVMGNQGATMQGTRLLREWIEAGLIGEVKEVYYWTNRPIWPQGTGLTFPGSPVPDTINWEVWQGSCATERPYTPEIHPFKWRGFWDYGCGALGDIGCHSMNSAFWALDLKGDFVVEASKVSEFDETMAPKRATIVYDFPTKGERGPVKIIWQDGVADPNTDKEFVRPPGLPKDLKLNSEFGQVFVGTEGTIFFNDAYCNTAPILFPAELKKKARTIKKVYARVKGGPTQELCRAIRGEGPKPVSNFEDHAGPLTEMVLAGNLAVRVGKKIDWDMERMEARGLPEVRAFLKREYRTGWEPDLT
ncbi:Gfo/Idh/MocA family protein [Haloferula rosea]|uniref:Gfo/Idh/MocA family oxidoreductase n=1 Tax=Haloferula rosea TaxID=490093 RepID=A0A934VEE2_9BACT|nr:Gfo/Idh/MocA family oxidoreductase [Haloferula rosea]MBK1825872.1 Gfo/Idh/MocA family oxidoreductase [Haloferula rosea]